MKGAYLNKLHRFVGIIIAPFMVIQVLSGLFLDFGLFRRDAATQGGTAATHAGWDLFLVRAHFGPGVFNDTYHILLACGIVWMAFSGWRLHLRIRRARRQAVAPGSRP